MVGEIVDADLNDINDINVPDVTDKRQVLLASLETIQHDDAILQIMAAVRQALADRHEDAKVSTATQRCHGGGLGASEGGGAEEAGLS
jgi:hypothetical protein